MADRDANASGSSILDASDTPRRDVLVYACGSPLAVVGIAVVSSVLWRDGLVFGVTLLLAAMLAGFLAFWWITRTGEVGGGRHEPSYGVHHVLTDDAQQRLRVVLFSLGILLWGILGLVAIYLLLSTFEGLPVYGPSL